MKKIITTAFTIIFTFYGYSQNTYPFPQSGNIGIGTTSPVTNLSIKANSADGLISYYSSLGSAKAYLGLAVAEGQMIPGANINDFIIRAESQKILFSTDGGSSNHLVLSSGNVGIGTFNPNGIYSGDNRTLHINAPTNYASELVQSNNQGTATHYLNAYQPQMGIYSPNSLIYDISLGGSSRFNIATNGNSTFSGNVGIGTLGITTSGEKFAVKSDLGSDVFTIYDNPGNVRLGIGQEASYTGNYIDSKNIDFKIKTGYAGGSGGNIIFMTSINGITSHNEQMRINKTGDVGIGTSDTKGYKLAVAGNVIAESVKVALQGNWPDYVFNPEYKLSPLQEVEKFIEFNNHLPEMPSATEVKKDGFDLGQMDAKLLKKIEELTLYMIEQNKLIQQQNERITILEKQIKK